MLKFLFLGAAIQAFVTSILFHFKFIEATSLQQFGAGIFFFIAILFLIILEKKKT